MNSPLLDADLIARIERLELVSRKIVSGRRKGERRSRRRGHSTEFADFRPYVPGDDLRFLDWNIYGRLDRLFLRVFLEEEDLRLDILIDVSPSMRFGDPDKLTYAKKIAAALGWVGLVHQDLVRIGAFADDTEIVFGPVRGRRHTRGLLSALESLEERKGKKTSIGTSARSFTTGSGRAGILVLITDFLERSDPAAALRTFAARAATTDIFVVHILAPDEIRPRFEGDLRLIDAEEGDTADISISRPLLGAYEKRLDRFRGEIQQYCRRVGMHYLFTSTDVPFDELVLGFLQRRGLLA
jgi:uncharacterized protein (DUF58 family)